MKSKRIDTAVKPVSRENPLILASGSRHRAGLLRRLGVPFEAHPADLDETPGLAETPPNLAQRLAREKAAAVAHRFPGRWVLGSDQVASLDGAAVSKPGTREAARRQLHAASGRALVFYTAVALLGEGPARETLDTTVVRFRRLDAGEVERYLDAEDALDCAGSFRVEGLGIALLTAVETRDPSALVGLPLIAVRELLAHAGLALP